MTAVKLQVAFLFKPWKHPAGFAPAFVFARHSVGSTKAEQAAPCYP
jgi:hypothetical protein